MILLTNLNKLHLKGTVNVILKDPFLIGWQGMSDFQRHNLNLYLSNNEEDFVIFFQFFYCFC